ncbi:MAG: DUF58 domain-containing protein [Gemmatimonadetes bacterium]|nr:DUF58 domain-containing protein [Gemmatimonadota bacterium]
MPSPARLLAAALRPAEERTGALGRRVRATRLGVAGAWARLRAWRRIRFTPGGLVFSVGSLAVGFAAMNTGNNLLYLLLGAMLGLIAVSSWMSEQAISGLTLSRQVARGVTVGHDVRIVYEVNNQKKRLPTIALELREAGLHEAAFFARVAARASESAASVHRFVRRGIYPLGTLTVSTSFPFGLFYKERDVELEGELVIWPRHDRVVRAPFPGAGRARVRGHASAGAPGSRGDYRGLRPYRPGDDPKDIHWKSSARLETPVVREYERDASETLWIVLDLVGEPGSDEAEGLVEVAASLAARAEMEGKRYGLVAGSRVVTPGSGPGQLEAALDALARADLSLDAEPPNPPVHPARCVLVSLLGGGAWAYGDAYVGTPVARAPEGSEEAA